MFGKALKFGQNIGRGWMGKAGPAAGGMGLGRMARGLANSAWSNPISKGTSIGAGAGALWGMASDDTSVLGGMAMGAGLGRYGQMGVRGAMAGRAFGLATNKGIGQQASMAAKMGGQGIWGGIRSDFSRGGAVRMAANRPYNAIKGLFTS